MAPFAISTSPQLFALSKQMIDMVVTADTNLLFFLFSLT